MLKEIRERGACIIKDWGEDLRWKTQLGKQRHSVCSLLALLGGSLEGGSSLLGGALKGRLGLHTGVEVEGGVVLANALDGALPGELLDDCAGKRAVDFVLVAEFSAGDAEDLGDVHLHFVPSVLVHEHIVVKLILCLDLGPGLLLGLSGLLQGINFLGDRTLRVLTLRVVLTAFRVLLGSLQSKHVSGLSETARQRHRSACDPFWSLNLPSASI